jgi:cell division protease FtsH
VSERRERERGEGGGERPGSERSGPPRGLLVLGLLMALLLMLTFVSKEGLGATGSQKPIDLMAFDRLLRRNEVAEVRFKDKAATVTLRPGDLRGEHESTHFTLNFNSDEGVEEVVKVIRELSSEDRPDRITTVVHQDPSNAVLMQVLVYYVLPTLVLFGLIYFFLFRQMRGPNSPGSLINFGKSRHRVAGEKANVTLKDVAGIDEARQDIEEIIEFLKNPTKFSRLGGRIPKGVLLIGPPGCGKTLLAKATAGEAGVPFFSVSGSDFVEMFVGVGASRVRDLFEKAKETSPCIIFLDEVDAVGRRRGSGLGGGHDEREQTLNQILVEMDGFDTDRGIIVMAATNRPDILDPALLRPGRFDRQVVISMPDVDGREQILRVHAKNKKLALEVELRTLAKATPGFSGAELEALLNEAALMAAMADRESISMRDLEEARDKIRWGRQRKSQRMVEKELRATAYHEAGHALVAASLEECDPLHKVTIVPRGRALGMTMSLPEQDRVSFARKQILAMIAMMFGGRLGEEVYTQDLSIGASDDIEKASGLARRMVTEWGMSEALGPIKYEEHEDTVFLGREIERHRSHSEMTLQEIDREIKRIVEAAYARAKAIIDGNRPVLERLAEALLSRETLSGDDVAAIIAGRALPPKPEAPAGTSANPPGAVLAPHTPPPVPTTIPAPIGPTPTPSPAHPRASSASVAPESLTP